MVLTKSSNVEMDLPVLSGMSWPSWKWLDDMFHDNEWRQSFKVEECTEGDSMTVRAELPGVDPEKDIEVRIADDHLVITAHKSESHETGGRHVHRSEFRYGEFTRSVPVPKGVDESKIMASYKDGVLEVRMALPHEAMTDKVHRVPVTRG